MNIPLICTIKFEEKLFSKRNIQIILIVKGAIVYLINPSVALGIDSKPAESLCTDFIILNQISIPFISSSFWLIGLSLILLAISIFFYNEFRKSRNENQILRKKLKSDDPFSDTNLLDSLIDNLPEFIYIKDENSRFVIANNNLGRAMGKESGYDLVGKTDYDFYPKHMANEYRKNEIEVMVNDSPILFKTEKALNEHGKEIYLSTSKLPLHDKNGKVIGIVGIGTDITETVLVREKLEQKNKDLHKINVLLEERQDEIIQQQEELKVYSEKLLEEKSQLRTLIDSMPDRIYIKDRKSRFLAANIHLSRILKAESSDSLIGKTDFDFHPKNLAEEFYRDEQKIMSTGVPLINKEEKGKDIEGREAIISTTKVPVLDKFGNIIGIVGIGREISKYKENEIKLIEQQNQLKEINVLLEEKQKEIQQQSEELNTHADNLLSINHELEKLSLVASSTDNIIIIMDAEGNFEWVNLGFERRYGSDLDLYTKTRGRNIRQNSFNKKIDEILDDVIRTKKPKIYDSQGSDSQGNKIWLQSTISPVLDDKGEIKKLIAIDSDITLIKEAEDQINQQKEEIEKQRDELKKLNATKDKFFSIIAHDLKNPFHSIIGFSELLSKNFDDFEDARKREFINLIHDSSSSAYVLLENLLNWSSAQTNSIKFKPEVINLNEIIHQNIQILSVNAQNKFISLHQDIPDEIWLFADQNMIDTIIRNLLTNAIKFTPEKGNVNIKCIIEENKARISVTDSGIGMDEETLSKLFRLEEFYKMPGTAGETGTGLGLIVCKEFILQHGSDLFIESNINKGSTFSFSLPLHKKN